MIILREENSMSKNTKVINFQIKNSIIFPMEAIEYSCAIFQKFYLKFWNIKWMITRRIEVNMSKKAQRENFF